VILYFTKIFHHIDIDSGIKKFALDILKIIGSKKTDIQRPGQEFPSSNRDKQPSPMLENLEP
jgi:hypothetical protein